MPPQSLQSVWIGITYWSTNLLTVGSGESLIDPRYDAGVSGSFFGPKPKLKNATQEARVALRDRALQVTVAYIPFNIHGNHWVYFKVEFLKNTITLHDPLPPQLSAHAKDTKRVLHRLAEWMAQVQYARRRNSQPHFESDEPAAKFSGLPTRFCTVTSITQKDGFQCALYCIGNILADASNKPGRVRYLSCERVRKWAGLLLWLNSRRAIVLTPEQTGMLLGSPPLGAVIESGSGITSAGGVMLGLMASSLMEAIVQHMVKEIGDTPPVTIAPLLQDWTPDGLSPLHSSVWKNTKPVPSAIPLPGGEPDLLPSVPYVVPSETQKEPGGRARGGDAVGLQDEGNARDIGTGPNGPHLATPDQGSQLKGQREGIATPQETGSCNT